MTRTPPTSAPRVKPTVARTRGGLARTLAPLRARGSLALVPTMGALHDGHRSLIRTARRLADHVVVSIFVNPLQFGPGEDFQRYRRPFAADLAVCREERVAVVFAPGTEVLYRSAPPQVTVAAGRLGSVLEGASRPGHFSGVLTVVTKLFHLVGPDLAVFGEKDAQQLVLVRRLVHDLDLPVHVVGSPTVRDPDGLALSSRNSYLTPAERTRALVLSRALSSGAAAAHGGPDAVRAAARHELTAEPEVRVDYLALVDPEQLTPVADHHVGPALLAVAAYVGSTRLIDNVTLTLPGRPA